MSSSGRQPWDANDPYPEPKASADPQDPNRPWPSGPPPLPATADPVGFPPPVEPPPPSDREVDEQARRIPDYDWGELEKNRNRQAYFGEGSPLPPPSQDPAQPSEAEMKAMTDQAERQRALEAPEVMAAFQSVVDNALERANHMKNAHLALVWLLGAAQNMNDAAAHGLAELDAKDVSKLEPGLSNLYRQAGRVANAIRALHGQRPVDLDNPRHALMVVRAVSRPDEQQ